MSELSDWKCEPSNYITEIRRMMYGFGDSSEPLIESATLINDVVQKQMKGIVYEACRVADRRQSDVVEEQDFLFLLRRDKVKLHRLLKYLQFKTTVRKVLDTNLFSSTEESSNEIKFDKRFHQFLSNIESPSDTTTVDHVKKARDLRAEMLSRRLDAVRYMEYSTARSASFANKYNHKFGSWIATEGDLKISKQAYAVLGYFAYETVAQIMDFAFLVKHDQTKIHGDALDRLRLGYCNPATYKPYQHGKGASMKPVTPSEINEALRRYWSPQLDKTGPFNRWSTPKQHPKFLAI
ncbi:transcription initiation protein SPT3 homolog [Diachasma alloeum]|uniref:transcription initiation protein SPT3 homolog n=1 Tax=Diachasma alloeum TaxID=454923 RepID=UPI0007382031|nr:transcription initiation protein SPT3 homolog [Diachasma alloeum]